MTSPRDRSRWIGALAGLVPAGAVATLFAVSGSRAAPDQVVASLTWTAAIATVAGWIAGPVAVSEPRRLIRSSFAYAVAVIGTWTAWSIAQAGAQAIADDGLDIGTLLEAIGGRGAYSLVSAAYLLIPAVAMGSVWSVVAHTLGRRSSR